MWYVGRFVLWRDLANRGVWLLKGGPRCKELASRRLWHKKGSFVWMDLVCERSGVWWGVVCGGMLCVVGCGMWS